MSSAMSQQASELEEAIDKQLSASVTATIHDSLGLPQDSILTQTLRDAGMMEPTASWSLKRYWKPRGFIYPGKLRDVQVKTRMVNGRLSSVVTATLPVSLTVQHEGASIAWLNSAMRFNSKDEAASLALRKEVTEAIANWPKPEKSAFASAATQPSGGFDELLVDMTKLAVPSPSDNFQLQKGSVWSLVDPWSPDAKLTCKIAPEDIPRVVGAYAHGTHKSSRGEPINIDLDLSHISAIGAKSSAGGFWQPEAA